ncbi:hypothetical protein PTKIN_Ptkin06aG0084900 [Pterospermum kingtungense]
MEIKMNVGKGRIMGERWGYKNCRGVDSGGHSGGLLLFWDDSVNLTVTSMNKNIILMYVSDKMNYFWATGIYENPETEQRYIVWDQLKIFSQSLGKENSGLLLVISIRCLMNMTSYLSRTCPSEVQNSLETV